MRSGTTQTQNDLTHHTNYPAFRRICLTCNGLFTHFIRYRQDIFIKIHKNNLFFDKKPTLFFTVALHNEPYY